MTPLSILKKTIGVFIKLFVFLIVFSFLDDISIKETGMGLIEGLAFVYQGLTSGDPNAILAFAMVGGMFFVIFAPFIIGTLIEKSNSNRCINGE